MIGADFQTYFQFPFTIHLNLLRITHVAYLRTDDDAGGGGGGKNGYFWMTLVVNDPLSLSHIILFSNIIKSSISALRILSFISVLAQNL